MTAASLRSKCLAWSFVALGCGDAEREAPRTSLDIPPPPATVTATPAPSVAHTPAPPPPTASIKGWGPETGFRSPQLLTDHYAKHGSEFGSITHTQYLRLAQALRDTPPGGNILETVRADGTTSRYDRSSGSFLAFNANGTIRTFFKPIDGEAYFSRQLKRSQMR